MSNTNNKFSVTRALFHITRCTTGALALAIVLVASPSPVRGYTLPEALNATNLTWQTYGSGAWQAETTMTHDGVAAAVSGPAYSGSSLLTTVPGPGTLTFWWSNQSSRNALYLIVGGVTVAYCWTPLWQQQTVYVGSGNNTLEWRYTPSGGLGDSYRGYLDEVSYTPGATAPHITSQPPSQSQAPGGDAVLSVEAEGTPPLYYQWRFNGTDISGATNSLYTVTNVQTIGLGTYSVLVTNGTGSVVSSNATLEFGEATGWGSPAYGDLAMPPGATNVIGISAGRYFSLLLKADGSVTGLGYNQDGVSTIPPNLTNAIAVSAGEWHCLALKADGTVAAWGNNDYGPTNVPAGLSNVVAIAAGRTPHSLVLKSDGTVATWGGWLQETNVPAGLNRVVAIAAGFGYDFVLKADGTLVTWGKYTTGVPMGLTNVVAIAAGDSHTLALLVDGTVVGWGDNSYGQVSVPPGLSNVVAIGAGVLHSLALRANGTVVAWGVNNLCQTNVPVGLTNVVAISAGYNHNLAQVGSGPPVLRASLSNPTLSEDAFSLSLPSQSGRVYALEYKSSLSDASWVSLPLVAGTGRNLVLRDTTATGAQRFYRVRRW